MRVPGGTAALLKAAGVTDTEPRMSALLAVIRSVHDVGPGIDQAVDQRRERFEGYLEAVAGFERASAPFRATPLRLATAEQKPARKSVEEFARAIGASLERDKKVIRVQPESGAAPRQRREWLAAAGLDLASLEASLNKGDAVSPSLPGDDVPLPLAEAAWRSLPVTVEKPERFAGSLLATLLGDRRQALLYHGLIGVDPETRRYLVSTPDLLAEIVRSDRIGAVPLFAASIHVQNGRINTPGGAAAVPLWEAIADEKVSRPDRFLLNVLGKDGGRLALLYDAVSHLEPGQQAFVLGQGVADSGERAERFRVLYDAFEPSLAGWVPLVRPFARVQYDPPHLFMLTEVTAEGRAVGPMWRRLWDAVLGDDEIPDNPQKSVEQVEKNGFVDAAWAAGTLLPASYQLRRDGAEMWFFAQRVFAGVPLTAAPDVLLAMRGFRRYRALALTLERLGVRAPATYAAAVRAARRLERIGDRERAARSLSLFQGALALVERARLARVIEVEATARLVERLSAASLSDDGEFLGSVASWIESDFLPAIGRAAGAPIDGDGSALEGEVLDALAGRRVGVDTTQGRTVVFEETNYRLDPTAPERTRLRAVREKQGGPSLDAVLAFAHDVLALARSPGDDVATLGARAKAIAARAARLSAAASGSDDTKKIDRDFADDVRDAVEDLVKIRQPRDLGKVEKITVPLRRGADLWLGRVLASLAYAASLADAENPALMAGDPAAQHDFGLLERDDEIRGRAAWQLPTQSRDDKGRWRVTGSVLALDVALRDMFLRRVSTDALPEAPTITENDRRAFIEAIVLANAFDYDDADMAAGAEALRRGRARIAVLASVPSRRDEVLGDARLDPVRRNLLGWAIEHERGRVPDLFSRGDLVRLGGLDASSSGRLDAWGTSGLSFVGCLCLRYPHGQSWTALSGRRGTGLMPPLVPDLPLLVVETLDDHRLPAALGRAMLAVTTSDLVDKLRLGFEDDWMTMVTEVERHVSPRLDDYLAAVVTSGPLVVTSKGEERARVP